MKHFLIFTTTSVRNRNSIPDIVNQTQWMNFQIIYDRLLPKSLKFYLIWLTVIFRKIKRTLMQEKYKATMKNEQQEFKEALLIPRARYHKNIHSRSCHFILFFSSARHKKIIVIGLFLLIDNYLESLVDSSIFFSD